MICKPLESGDHPAAATVAFEVETAQAGFHLGVGGWDGDQILTRPERVCKKMGVRRWDDGERQDFFNDTQFAQTRIGIPCA